MANVEIERVGNQISFKYVYESAGKDPKKDPEKFVTGAFSVRKDAREEDIKIQLAEIIKELLAKKKIAKTSGVMEVSLA